LKLVLLIMLSAPGIDWPLWLDLDRFAVLQQDTVFGIAAASIRSSELDGAKSTRTWGGASARG
jgi:hypothetical protein